ncbi:MAG: hypothetical protein M1831_001042 [Alyxoria varia]|nr:MAG: hypothetical protein M1831_001042 [Alyxoria varia]
MSSQVDSNATAIYTGTWVNWSKGPIFGSQITLNAQSAQVLSSFLGIYVTYVGVQLWQILSFALHQRRSKEHPVNAWHHQSQLVFRNITSPWSAAKVFAEQLWAWRKSDRHTVQWSIIYALAALIYGVAFAGLSVIAASEITKGVGTARLLRPTHCAVFDSRDTNGAQQSNRWAQALLQSGSSAAQYARSCYPGNSSITADCDYYPVQYLDYDVSHDATCPFSDGICKMNETQPLVIDSGLLDTQRQLGINSRPNERLQYRRKLTCSPLRTTGYSRNFNVTRANNDDYPGDIGDTKMGYEYGPVVGNNFNYTTAYDTHTVLDLVRYTVEPYAALAGHTNELQSWTPIAALNRTDADVQLVLIGFNSMQYLQRCEDPVFKATTFIPTGEMEGEPIGFWSPNFFMSAIACAESHDFCNPNNDKCTGFGGAYQSAIAGFQLGLNKQQERILYRLSSSMALGSLSPILTGRGGEALVAQETSHGINGLQQAPLPDDQWEIEVQSWFKGSMAYLQQEVQQYPRRSAPTQFTTVHNDQWTQNMCHNQLTLDTQGTVSYSMFGLCFTIILGTLIILLAFVSEPLVSFFQTHKVNRRGTNMPTHGHDAGTEHHCERCDDEKKSLDRARTHRYGTLSTWLSPPLRFVRRSSYRHRDWTLNNMFQLQRIFLESRDVGPWKGWDDAVPVTVGKGVEQILWRGWSQADLVAKGEVAEGSDKNDEQSDSVSGASNSNIAENHPSHGPAGSVHGHVHIVDTHQCDSNIQEVEKPIISPVSDLSEENRGFKTRTTIEEVKTVPRIKRKPVSGASMDE